MPEAITDRKRAEILEPFITVANFADAFRLDDDGLVVRRDSFFDPLPVLAHLLRHPSVWPRAARARLIPRWPDRDVARRPIAARSSAVRSPAAVGGAVAGGGRRRSSGRGVPNEGSLLGDHRSGPPRACA